MTSEEFRQTRERLGYTKAELARFLGVSIHAVIKWEHGQRAVPPLARKVLQWMDQGKLP